MIFLDKEENNCNVLKSNMRESNPNQIQYSIAESKNSKTMRNKCCI